MDHDKSSAENPGTLPLGDNIENTLSGNTQLDFSDVMGEAWRSSGGVRVPVLVGAVGYAVLASALMGILNGVFGIDNDSNYVAGQIGQFIVNIAVYPLLAGIFIICLRHSIGQGFELGDLLHYYPLTLQLALLALLQSLAVSIGFLLLVVPGIYLSIALCLAMPLMVERGFTIVEALTTSLKLVNEHFFTVAGLLIVTALISAAGIITVIGWIWAFPCAAMVLAILYRQLAGITETGIAAEAS